MRYATVLAAVALTGLATACTDNDPIEGGMASATAVITDDASSSLRSDAGLANQSAGTYAGTFTGDAQVSIGAEGEAWVDLGSPTPATVELQSTRDETTVHAGAMIPAGLYTRVRLILTGAEATVGAGAVLEGVTVTSDSRIAVGGSDNQVVIEKAVQPFTVNARAHARILFDLNSEGWIHRQSVEEESAEDEEVRESATATRSVDEDVD